jgi:hypothetical protein
VGLSAIRAAAAGVGGFSLLTVLVYVADEYPTFEAGTRTLQASVVRLYSVVVILSRWVRVGCARLCSVHWGPFPLGQVPGSGRLLRGHLFVRRPHSSSFSVLCNYFIDSFLVQ